MTIKVKRNGAWVNVANGKLAVDRGTVWNNPAKVYAKWNGVWVDSGYLPPAGTPGSPTVTGWSPTTVSVTWPVPVGGVAPTSYVVTLMNASRGVISTQTVAASAARNAGFTGLSNSTRYILTVTSVAAGAASATSGDLRIELGRPEITVTNPVYGWSSVITSVRPENQGVSWSAPASPSNLAYDTDGATGWRSAGTFGSSGPLYWEYMLFGSPGGTRKLVSVSVNAPVGLQFYLGMLGLDGQTWYGALSFTEAQMAYTGYPWGTGDGTIIQHFYVAASPTSPEWREVNVENFNFVLSNFGTMQLAITNLLSIDGNWKAQVNDIYVNYRDWVQTGTSTTVTQTAVANGYW
jgi:hypothetical protein